MWRKVINFFLKVYPDWTRSDAMRMAYNETAPRIVSTKLAIKDRKIVGQVNIILFKASKTVANLGYHVHPNYHRQGIGKALCKEAIKDALHKKVKILVVEANKNNIASISLAKYFGFEKASIDFIKIYGEQLKCTKKPGRLCFTLHLKRT